MSESDAAIDLQQASEPWLSIHDDVDLQPSGEYTTFSGDKNAISDLPKSKIAQ